MREVNLMARRAQRYRGGASALGPWLGAGAVIIVAWAAAGVAKVARIGRETAMAQAVVERIAAEQEELVSLVNEYEGLRQRAARTGLATRSMPPAAPLSLISRLVPEQVELEELDLKMPGRMGPADGKVLRGSPASRAQIQVKGVSVNEAAAVGLLKNLTASPYLTGVRAEEQHHPIGGEDLHARFSVSMEMGSPSPRQSKDGGRP